MTAPPADPDLRDRILGEVRRLVPVGYIAAAEKMAQEATDSILALLAPVATPEPREPDGWIDPSLWRDYRDWCEGKLTESIPKPFREVALMREQGEYGDLPVWIGSAPVEPETREPELSDAEWMRDEAAPRLERMSFVIVSRTEWNEMIPQILAAHKGRSLDAGEPRPGFAISVDSDVVASGFAGTVGGAAAPRGEREPDYACPDCRCGYAGCPDCDPNGEMMEERDHQLALVKRAVNAELRLSGGPGRLDDNEWSSAPTEPAASLVDRAKESMALCEAVEDDDCPECRVTRDLLTALARATERERELEAVAKAADDYIRGWYDDEETYMPTRDRPPLTPLHDAVMRLAAVCAASPGVSEAR